MSEIPKSSQDEKRLALESVLQSSAFERADLLKKFLRYVCEMEIAGRGDELSEYTIGIEALGRPTTYSPGEDSSVRSRAHAVREKLAAFYEAEGAAAALRIELRKGSYIPHFVPRVEAEIRIEHAQPNSLNSPSRTLQRPVRAFIAGLVTASLAAILTFALWRPPKTADPVAPVLREFWGPLLRPGGEVILCVATAPSMLLHSFRDDTLPPTARIFPAPDEVVKWYAALNMQDGGGRLYSQSTLNTTLFGDNLAAIAAVKTLTAAGKAVQILPEYSIRPLALRGRDVMMIGSPNYSPFAARILRKTPFSVRYDPATRLEVISTEASNGESPVVYSSERDQKLMGLKRAYGLITILQSPSPSDESHRTVLFSGISSAGTQAAMEFFCSAASMRELKSRLTTAASRSLPLSYQIVVRCGVDNNLALDWAYEGHRIVEKPPLIE